MLGSDSVKVLVTGSGGQLGCDCLKELAARRYVALGTDVKNVVQDSSVLDNRSFVQLDVTDYDDVKRIVEDFHPDAVVHCAAWTAVDDAESEENRDKVDRINRLGASHIAEAAKKVDAKMVYISTDYVFDGSGERPWNPDGERYSPLNVYGWSKLDGELAVSGVLSKFFIVRTAWLFGLNGNNFVKTMINVGKKRDVVRVVKDQIGSPTYTRDLARLLVDMIESEKYGRYHATNEGGYVSWYEFCREIYKQYGLETRVLPVTTAEYGLSKAARPLNSRLEKKKLVESGFTPLPLWTDALSRYLREARL